jgi:hypothetical protein
MATPASTITATTTAPAAATATQHQADIIPSETTLQHAASIALQHDRPILLDYYVDTATGKAFLGEDNETKEKVLVKSRDEFTSSVQKSFKVGEDFLIFTENSIYIVSGKITKKKISMASLIGDL